MWPCAADVSAEAAASGIDEYGTYLKPSHGHALRMFVRDASRAFCQRCCELDRDELAAQFARRAERLGTPYACAEAACTWCADLLRLGNRLLQKEVHDGPVADEAGDGGERVHVG